MIKHTVSISSARLNLLALAQYTIDSHQPITLTSKHGNAVLISEDDFRAMQGSAYNRKGGQFKGIMHISEDFEAPLPATYIKEFYKKDL